MIQVLFYFKEFHLPRRRKHQEEYIGIASKCITPEGNRVDKVVKCNFVKTKSSSEKVAAKHSSEVAAKHQTGKRGKI